MYEKMSISKLKIVIEMKRLGIMTYIQNLFFNVISIQIKHLFHRFTSRWKPVA
jgi:hypothetical protein